MYEFLKLRSYPKKHWSDKASWEITKDIPNEVLKTTKLVVQNSNFISLTHNEVTTMDITSWATVLATLCKINVAYHYY